MDAKREIDLAFRVAGRLEVASRVQLVEPLARELDRLTAMTDNYPPQLLYAIELRRSPP